MTQDSSRKISLEIAQDMARRGITSVPVNHFYYREFHYTNLQDALAQSTRDRIRLGLIPG